MIEVKNLVKKYGNHIAIDHLDFKIEQGKIYGFLGPNGAGKSTTMNIMTGYLGATQGEVIINGHDILKEPEEAKKDIGYLPEIPPLYTEMTVREYLGFAAELKRIPKGEWESSIEEVMKLTKLMDVRDRLIRNISKGYKQRVGLAQAVLGFPDIIILDEPTVGLDPKQIIEIRELIRNLAKKHTVILSSHILAEVREVCDYIMIISKGKLVASDTPENLEHLMDGAESVEIEAKADASKMREILDRIPEIASVKIETQENGITSTVITTKQHQDIREKIFLTFAEAKCPLLTLKSNRASLEEIFLELTQGEAVLNKDEKEDETNAGDL
ncbi:MAG: ABC transporter ATP-binding protein [Faecalicatena sp.]|uniref:ABC transporter ATP-binding protein n=1 Tax=Faecalicatena sp. TaxID=2005360 RepID=UPI0025859F5E|nr:ABC transporter ATP-binding protein [Faecalicatena sp.]MCI6464507.1 ABC transporter ATP-binding protein [Faecalicatena sp.]MDY5619069.1 ABC transporter ATP-binding protein [Lachnospiraceae bacterium]